MFWILRGGKCLFMNQKQRYVRCFCCADTNIISLSCYKQVDLTKVIETHVFQFDDAFEAGVTNEEIYERTVKHLMGVLFQFGKASCFAYGQTGMFCLM